MTRARECGDKRGYERKEHAKSHLWALTKAGARASRFQIYKCRFCGLWHIGHKKRRRR